MFNLSQIEIQFFWPDYFEENAIYFPSKTITVELGCQKGNFELISKTVPVSDASKPILIDLPNNVFCTRFIKINFNGKLNKQFTDNLYYVAVKYVKILGTLITEKFEKCPEMIEETTKVISQEILDQMIKNKEYFYLDKILAESIEILDGEQMAQVFFQYPSIFIEFEDRRTKKYGYCSCSESFIYLLKLLVELMNENTFLQVFNKYPIAKNEEKILYLKKNFELTIQGEYFKMSKNVVLWFLKHGLCLANIDEKDFEAKIKLLQLNEPKILSQYDVIQKFVHIIVFFSVSS